MYTDLLCLYGNYRCKGSLLLHEGLVYNAFSADRAQDHEIMTFNTRCGGILQRVHRQGNILGAGWGVWDRAYLWGTLAQVCPFMRISIVETVRYGTI
jgi:hypothetical protein